MKPKSLRGPLMLVALAFLATAISSCGAYKRISNKQESNLSAEAKQETSVKAKEESKLQSDAQGSSKAKITEKADTTIKTPGKAADGAKPLDNLVGGQPLVVESNGLRTEVSYDPTTGNVKAKSTVAPEEHRVQVGRTTEVEQAWRQQLVEVEKRLLEFEQRNQAKLDSLNKARSETVERDAAPWYFAPWPWAILFVVLAFLYIRYGSPLKWMSIFIKRISNVR